jgi:hypothetical protein
MSITDTLFGIIDNVGLKDMFDRKKTDLKSLRAPLLKGIERCRDQFGKSAKGPNRWWSVKNGVVALSVKVRGDTFDINGVSTNHMPEDRFPEFLDHFRDAVNAGEFDAELINHGEGTAQVHIAKKRSGLSAEAAKARGVKAAASCKANRAAREAGADS